MANFKYLSATFLALFLSLASCNNAPSGPTDPGNPGGGNPPGPVTTLDTASFKFSEYFSNEQSFTTHLEQGAFMIESYRGTNTKYPVYYSNGSNLRFYHGNYFTVSGTKMTEIYFDASYNNHGTVTASVGTYDYTTKKWTGDATSVTFTIGASQDSSGQFRVVAMSINQALDGDDTGGGGTDDDPPVVTTGDYASFVFENIYSATTPFTSYSKQGITLTAAKGSASADPSYYPAAGTESAGSLRLYAGNTLTISGTSITRIDFEFNSKAGTFTSNTGTMGDTTWTGSANSITLTVASGQRRIISMNVYATLDGTDPGGGGTGGDTTTKTLLSVFQDVYQGLFGDALSVSDAANYWDSDYSEYAIGLDWGTTDETSLQEAVQEYVDYYAPEYLIIVSDVAADTWADDGSDGYFATLSTEDGAITVDIGSYIEDGYVVLNVEVYEE